MLVGISDLMPKMLASRILQPALAMEQLAQIVCDEDTQERMLAQLADHRLDFVLSAAPIPPLLRVKSFNHLLGSCTLTVLAAHNLTNKYRKTFPSSLNGAPFLLPMEGASLRRSLEQWFD